MDEYLQKHVYKRQFIETNGITLHTIEAGNPSNPLVILLHGFPEFWYGWRHQISAIADAGFYVLVPDQRGYGRSDKPSGVASYAIDELVKDILGLIDYAGREKAIVIGHDWGALVAWWIALLHPERLEKLGILNVPHPYVFKKTAASNFKQTLKSSYAIAFQIPLLPEWMMSIGGYEVAAQVIKMSGKKDTFTKEEMDEYKKAWQRKDAMQSMINWYRAYVRNPPKMPENRRISVPTLMIWGEKDVALDFSMVQPSIDLCDHGKLVTIPHATHWVQHDASDQVRDLLVNFVKGDEGNEEG